MPIFSKKLKVGLSIDGAMPPQYRYMNVIRMPQTHVAQSPIYYNISSAYDPTDLSVDKVTHEYILNNSIGIQVNTFPSNTTRTYTLYVDAEDGSYADVITGSISSDNQWLQFNQFNHTYNGRVVACVGASGRRLPLDNIENGLPYIGDLVTLTVRLFFAMTPDGKIWCMKYANAINTPPNDTYGEFGYNNYVNVATADVQGVPVEVEYPDAEDDDDDGGGGDFDPSSDPIDFPDGIDVSNLIANAEIMNVYAVSQASLLLLNDFLWSDNFFDNVKKVFNSPMQSVAGLYLLPFSVTGSSAHIEVGGIDTEIASQKVSDFVKIIDIGALSVNEFWGNFLDYENTTVKIYLPFVGFQVLETKKVVGATLSIRYKIDVLSGDFQAFIKRTKGDYTHVLYTFSGNMAIQLPLSQSANATLANSLLGLTQGIGATLIGGGSGALALSALSTVGTAMAQNAFGDSKTIQHNGSYGGNKGYMGEMTPYIIIERAKQQIPTNYNRFVGIPSYFRTTLSECHGFTKVQTIHLVCSATAEEKNQIENLLKSGVIL